MRRLAVPLILVLVLLGVPLPAVSAAPAFTALVFSKVNGFRHDSIPAGVAAIQSLGTSEGFTVESTEDAAAFTDANLARFDVVIFNNTNSRDGAILSAAQRAAFERYVRAGGGYVGVHSASGTEYDWPWYGQLMGAFFKSHPAIQPVTIEVHDRVHPSTKDLPQRWTRTEEPYDFQTNPLGSVHVLASFDADSYTGHTMGVEHPISWCQEFDGGRSWYTGLGHHATAFSEPLFRAHLLGGIRWAAGVVPGDCGATEEDRYEKVLLDGTTDDPLDMDIDARGRVFFVERGGAVKVYDPVSQAVAVAARLDVFVEHTHGNHGLILDPGFETNHWLYIYWSPTNDTVIRLSRFTYREETQSLDLSSEKVLLRVPSQRVVNAHEGGGMAFDAAGNLYLGTGDNTFPSQYAAIDERAGQANYDAQRTAGNTNDLRGKILRIRPQPDGTYTVPAGNLFPPGTAKTRPEIYVMGLRQPYRIHVDPETGWLYWGDVGPDAPVPDPGDPPNPRGPHGYDEWNQARTAGNYGWPYCIANNQAYKDYNYATGAVGAAFNCAAGPTNNSPNNTGAGTLPPGRSAWIWYPYGTSTAFPDIAPGSNRLAIGGPTYHYNSTLDSEVKFPPYYDDTVFVAEWTRHKLYEVKLDAAGQPIGIQPFLPHMQFLKPIDLEFGPDGAMYVLEWGSNYGGSGRDDPNVDSGLYKIDHVRPGLRRPIVKASATPTSGQPPLTVTFSSAGTVDPDGQALSYAWDFTSDGTVDSTAPNPVFTYTTRGDHLARLTVTDPTGRTGQFVIPVTVGNTAPVVTMLYPGDGQVFEFGDVVDARISVTDAEDGTIDCQQVITQPALGHDQHAHPLQQYRGCQVPVQTLADNGHTVNDQMFYVLDSTYTDRGGTGASALRGGDSVILQPRRKQAEHWTRAGNVVLYSTKEPDGGRMVGQIGHGDWISFEPVNLRGITTLVFRVASAGTGGTIEVRTGSTTGPLVGSAAVSPTGGSYTFTTVSAAVTDPGGSHELFLVFKHNPGDGYLFNLDWVEFRDTLGTPVPLTGDFDGDGDSTAGLAGKAGNEFQWMLTDRHAPGPATQNPFRYGNSACTPVTGDWDGSGTTTIGAVCKKTGSAEWWWNLRNVNGSGVPSITSFGYGSNACTPVTGDWNGDGTTTIGVACKDGAEWRWNLRNSNGSGPADAGSFTYGSNACTPLTGDWNGDGTTTIAVACVQSGATEWTWSIRNANASGTPSVTPFRFGGTGCRPVTGDWDGVGGTTVGVACPSGGRWNWSLINALTSGSPSYPTFRFGTG